MINKDTLVKGQKIYKRYPDGQIQGFIVSYDPYPTIGVKREGDVYLDWDDDDYCTTVNTDTEHNTFTLSRKQRMIKIHDKLWYVIKPEDKENLAYMCQYQTDKDDKWTDAFLSEYKYGSNGQKYRVNTFSKPKIVEIVKHEPLTIAPREYSWYCPQRVKNQSNLIDRWSYVEAELIDVEYKK